MTTRQELQAELDQFEAANEAATGSGAAVGARRERIKGIRWQMERMDADEEDARLADELMAFHDCCTQDAGGGDGSFRIECSSGSDAQARALRSVLREAATAFRSRHLAQGRLKPAETKRIAADAIRTFCRSLGAGAFATSQGVERIYYSGISLDALATAVALAMTSTDRQPIPPDWKQDQAIQSAQSSAHGIVYSVGGDGTFDESDDETSAESTSVPKSVQAAITILRSLADSAMDGAYEQECKAQMRNAAKLLMEAYVSPSPTPPNAWLEAKAEIDAGWSGEATPTIDDTPSCGQENDYRRARSMEARDKLIETLEIENERLAGMVERYEACFKNMRLDPAIMQNPALPPDWKQDQAETSRLPRKPLSDCQRPEGGQ